MATMTGKIIRLMSGKGFGFVSGDGDTEYFFHQSACNGVQFDDLLDALGWLTEDRLDRWMNPSIS